MAIDVSVKTNTPGAIQRSTQYVDVYANSLQCRVSPFDLSISFMRTVFNIDGSMHPEEQATVMMSPQMFKNFVGTVNKILKVYEDGFGEIPKLENAKQLNLDSLRTTGGESGQPKS